MSLPDEAQVRMWAGLARGLGLVAVGLLAGFLAGAATCSPVAP